MQPTIIASESRVAILREVLSEALCRSAPCPAILLSGGVDTCIIAEFGHEILGLRQAITVLTSPSATDDTYAREIATKIGLDHHVITLPSPMELVQTPEVIEFVIQTLKTFDPMEVRNAVVIARGLLECKKLGIEKICTGDGADELFAGYSFMQNMSPERLDGYRRTLTKIWRFSAATLGAALGVQVVQPFLDPQVVRFAVDCTHGELVGNDKAGRTTGKLILRRAFPETTSCWRKKEPIEVGAGTTVLPELFAQSSDSEQLQAHIDAVWDADRVKIRDAEHYYYYTVFKRVFGGINGRSGLTRYGSDSCKSCGFQIESSEQSFCVVCGEWPARE